MTTTTTTDALRFQPWQSAPDVSFWQKLAALKLDTFQLSDQAQDLVAYFTPGRSATVPARLTVDESSFVTSGQTTEPVDRVRYEWTAPGVLYNTNTLEDFKNLDKSAVLQKAGERVLTLLDDPNASLDALNTFVLVTFADLKKHSFLYWFGFPALATSTPLISKAPAPVSSVLSTSEQATALRELLALRHMNEDGSTPLSNFPSFFVIQKRTGTDGGEIRVSEFQQWRQQDNTDAWDECLFGFVDPCPLATNPGWPLRNYLALISSLPSDRLPRDRPVKILSFREHIRHLHTTTEEFTWNSSLVFEVETGDAFTFQRESVKIVGWEANARGKMGPRIMELGSILDPIRLAEQSVDLNLKLMLWRQLPSLQLDVLANTKCLVLGAGTLGCYTARSLLSWGFRHITLADNSVVSHSNPVRQPLFEFQDVGKPKAECAANSLKRIFPLVNSRGVHLSIPMAGHALSNTQLVDDAKQSLEQLQELIDSHDVVFLGTDSRESRWLPTVICAAKKKLLLNAALGFDSYLVMRHGVGATESSKSLGCYFCNDIVSPRDSLKDRTLDQMCTVTRPGLAPMAAATAVELLVAVLHSPDGVLASAEKPVDGSVPLSFVPHQQRGFLNSFATMVITGEAFDKCIACSTPVLSAYNDDAFALLQHACNSSTYLEELTGLQKLTEAADSFMDELEDDEHDDDALL
ncbi:hypothetical protein Poli38472_012243 [Pythium oligandrum]|uniref:Ubiquitin-like modifier-activating enzyme ATG7 n=1 Tax=Pythium oligandrum TaxID=41045 RepID=A0A8K1FPP8_PYTOL|nr:hypothetical protein Poli38472_012243 [Pythium oligandrum]|eukprot:TMW67127.1 hypothetical protein Poli38472_012243 [Pythium oligandrum]